MKRLIALLLVLCALTLTACAAAPAAGGQGGALAPGPAAPAGPLAYLISPPSEDVRTTTLSLIDTGSWSLWRSVELPLSKVESVARDRRGRIWVRLWRNTQELDNRVQVY